MKYWFLALLVTAGVLLVGWFAGLIPPSLFSSVITMVGVFGVVVSNREDLQSRWGASFGILILGAVVLWFVHWAPAAFVVAAGLGLVLSTLLWAILFSRRTA